MKKAIREQKTSWQKNKAECAEKLEALKEQCGRTSDKLPPKKAKEMQVLT